MRTRFGAQRAPSRPSRLRSLRLWVTVGIALLVAAILVSAGGAVFERGRAETFRTESRTRLRPAQDAADRLATAFVEQETGIRSYQVTRRPAFLQPYTSGRQTAAQLQVRLESLLRMDARSERLMRSIAATAQVWQTQGAEPQIAAAAAGDDDLVATLRLALVDTGLFNVLRAELESLSDRIDTLVTVQLDRFDAAQSDVDRSTSAALILAVVAAALCLLLLHRMLTRPLNRLLGQVQTVADGVYDEPIDTRGPQEVAMLAAAVDRMRANLLETGREAAAAQHQLSVHDERTRMAADLHDLIIQRIYGLSLSLASIGRRWPQLQTEVDALTDQADQISLELRRVIFAIGSEGDAGGLRSRVTELAADSRRSLGFTPRLVFQGPVDVLTTSREADPLLAVLREALSNIARHARATSAAITVAVTDGAQPSVRLTVADDGVGISPAAARGQGTRNLHARAELLGGNATIAPGASRGTTVSWQVPVA